MKRTLAVFPPLAVFLMIAPCCLGQTRSPMTADTSTHCPVATIQTKPIENVDAPKGTADLNSVIASVEAALKCYQDNRGSGPDALPALQQAQFDFKTTTGKVGGITVSFFIFKIGASKEKDVTNQLSFTYVLPPPKPPKTVGEHVVKGIPPQPLADAIVADLQSAAAAVKDGAKLGDLAFNKLTVVLQFGVIFDGNVSINVPIHLVMLGASGDYKKNEAQTVTLTFAAPAAASMLKRGAGVR
ncbi:MAG: hypothetical protein WA800_04365 [Terriglobales bacterium]